MTLEALHSMRADLVAALAKVDDLIEKEVRATSAPVVDDAEVVRAMPRTKAIEWLLERGKGKSFRPVEIWAGLQATGRNDPKMEIQVTTYDLWERGRIGKSGRGQYHAL